MDGEDVAVVAGRATANPHASGIIPTLQNIVATVNLSCKLDLKIIAMGARNAEYNPKRFAAVIMRIREPKTTALIFASGKMVRTDHSKILPVKSDLTQCRRVALRTYQRDGTQRTYRSARGPRAKRLRNWLHARCESALNAHPLTLQIFRRDESKYVEG